MTIYALAGVAPRFADRARAFVAPDAAVIGTVELGLDVSIWFGAVVRGDKERIVIGDRTNIQDGAVVHADPGAPTQIGADCTIGHRAIVHGATIGTNCLIGMGATILNGAVIGEDSIVGANALVTEGKRFPPGSLIVGAPAAVRRPLTPDEIARNAASAAGYVANGRRFSADLRALPEERGAPR